MAIGGLLHTGPASTLSSAPGLSEKEKTALTAVMQAHFGQDFHDRNLPGNWASTENTLEKQAFLTPRSDA